VAEAQRLLLPRVTDLHHVADLSNHFHLIFPAFLFQEAFEGRSGIEVVFDGILAFAGDDDDVLDARSNALFSDVLDLGLVDNSEHFFGLSFGGGEEARAEARGRKHRFADFVAYDRGSNVGRGRGMISHRLSFSHTLGEWTPFFDAAPKQSMLLRGRVAS
jgi:hypothetical protein